MHVSQDQYFHPSTDKPLCMPPAVTEFVGPGKEMRAVLSNHLLRGTSGNKQ